MVILAKTRVIFLTGCTTPIPTYTFRDNVSKIVGKHNLQFGAYVVTAQKNELGGELAAGSVPGYLTFDPSVSEHTTGNPFADLLTGHIASFGQQDQFVKYYNRYKIVEPYFHDDWRITNRLTLNLGLRVSLFGPTAKSNSRLSISILRPMFLDKPRSIQTRA